MRFAKTGAAGRSGSSFHARGTLLAATAVALSGCVTPAPKVDTRLPAAYAAPAQAPDARLAAARLEEARATRQGQIRQLYIPSTPLTGSAKRTDTDIID